MTAFLRRLLAVLMAPFRPAKPYVAGPVRCANCGWHGFVAVSVSSPHYNAELGVLDLIQCPGCRLFLVCSS